MTNPDDEPLTAVPWRAAQFSAFIEGKTDALLSKQRLAARASNPRLGTREPSVDAADAAREDAHASAYAALVGGEALPLMKVVSAEVHNYSEVRLRLALAADWLPSACAAACELVLQAHSSAAMLAWLELLKATRESSRTAARASMALPPHFP